jgi:hypothetical protein
MKQLQAPHSSFALWQSPLAIGPVLFLGTFVMRSAFPAFDPLVFSITIALLAVVVCMFAGQRWAGAAFQVFPVALFTSPAGREFSFNLSAVDDRIWRWHAVVGLVSLGVGMVASVFVMLGRRPGGWTLGASLLGGAGIGALMVAAMAALFGHPGFGQTLSAQTIDSLPVIDMVNYAYDVPELNVQESKNFAIRVKNPSNLPHTITIDSLGIDLYVPAGRSSVLELTAEQMAGPVPIYCTVGDHRALGMQRNLKFTVQ